MKRTKLKDRILPKYSKGEEIFNMTSHIVGGALGIVALVLCVVFAAIHHNGYGVVSGAIYGVTMILLYTMSSIYHGLKPERFSKKVFQVLDHCSIFLLIAGSYTPFCLCTFREYNTALGWTIFGIIWAIAILGIVYLIVRMYLENDAMIKARYLAKEYMEEKEISTKEEIEKMIQQYDIVNDLGIKCVHYQLALNVLAKIAILSLVCFWR